MTDYELAFSPIVNNISKIDITFVQKTKEDIIKECELSYSPSSLVLPKKKLIRTKTVKELEDIIRLTHPNYPNF